MAETTIIAISGGPYKATGSFVILDAEGNDITNGKETAFLCRCGASKNKPFCDGTHKTTVFDSPPES